MREKWRDLEERSRKQAEDAGVRIVTDIDRKPFKAAMAGIYAKAQRDLAMAELGKPDIAARLSADEHALFDLGSIRRFVVDERESTLAR